MIVSCNLVDERLKNPQKGGFRHQDITDCLNRDLLCLSRLTFAETHPHGDFASAH